MYKHRAYIFVMPVTQNYLKFHTVEHYLVCVSVERSRVVTAGDNSRVADHPQLETISAHCTHSAGRAPDLYLPRNIND